jgi:hypothetical protein
MASLPDQWFATGDGAPGKPGNAPKVQWETIDFYEGLRDSARIV